MLLFNSEIIPRRNSCCIFIFSKKYRILNLKRVSSLENYYQLKSRHALLKSNIYSPFGITIENKNIIEIFSRQKDRGIENKMQYNINKKYLFKKNTFLQFINWFERRPNKKKFYDAWDIILKQNIHVYNHLRILIKSMPLQSARIRIYVTYKESLIAINKILFASHSFITRIFFDRMKIKENICIKKTKRGLIQCIISLFDTIF